MIEIGQRYSDNDPRLKQAGEERVGEVIEVVGDKVKLRWSTGRTTLVKACKLGSATSTGYTLVE